MFQLELERIRKAIDPESRFLTDADIERTLRITGGHIYRSTVRCLVMIQQKARIHKNPMRVEWTRNMLSRLEAGVLKV